MIPLDLFLPEGSRTGENLAQSFMNVISEYNLEGIIINLIKI